jgi:hypothetical protein
MDKGLERMVDSCAFMALNFALRVGVLWVRNLGREGAISSGCDDGGGESGRFWLLVDMLADWSYDRSLNFRIGGGTQPLRCSGRALEWVL